MVVAPLRAGGSDAVCRLQAAETHNQSQPAHWPWKAQAAAFVGPCSSHTTSIFSLRRWWPMGKSYFEKACPHAYPPYSTSTQVLRQLYLTCPLRYYGTTVRRYSSFVLLNKDPSCQRAATTAATILDALGTAYHPSHLRTSVFQ